MAFIMIQFHIIRFKPFYSKGRIVFYSRNETYEDLIHKHGKLLRQHNYTYSSLSDKINLSYKYLINVTPVQILEILL